ncbi:MAG: twin-arginine translocation signal domain-containing protein, partial [Rubripirellula sp.]
MSRQMNRRRFLKQTSAVAGTGFFSSSVTNLWAQDSPNERPVFATVGLRNQGWTITNKSIKFADFAAFADVDENVLG